ncbi:MAG TPA: hypothetical protein VF933_23800 [Streptosporangiaceae bacterium]
MQEEPDRSTGDGEEERQRYRRIRTAIEFVKLGVWVVLETLRHS